MEARLKVLELFLDALGEDTSIDSLDDRLRVQKAVYLGQALGVDLGYRYSWYIKGPYCTALTQDYYQLDQQKAADTEPWELHQEVAAKMRQVREVLNVPDNIPLAKPQWYELIASLHYLYKVSKLAPQQVRETMSQSKPHLSSWVDQAEQHLRQKNALN